MNRALKTISLLVCFSPLSACVGFVGGDLAGIDANYRLSACSIAKAKYELEVISDAEDDYSEKNISGYISSFTLGLFPTYWLSFIENEVQISKGEDIVYSRSDNSRVHKFYGLLWVFVLDDKSINALKSDEGAGIRVASGINARAIEKTLKELPKHIKISELCLRQG